MKRQKVWWVAGMLALLLVSSGVILAQKSDRVETDRTFVRVDGGHAWLGVRLGDVTSDSVRDLKLPGEYGAVVERVVGDGPAAKAGLEKNDVILEFNGQRVWSAAELRRMLEETPAGRTVELRVSRAGQSRHLSAKLEARGDDMLALAGPSPLVRVQPPMVEVHPMPQIDMSPFAFDFGELMGGPRLGIEAQELTSQLASYFGVKQGKGVLVGEVKAGTPAEKAGLKAGDCIIAVDGKEVSSVEDLRHALRGESSEKRQHTLTLVRDRHEQTVTVEIEPRKSVEPKTAGQDIEDLDDEISSLRDAAPQARLEAENLRRQLADQAAGWRAQAEIGRAGLEKLRKELTLEAQAQARQQAALARSQAQELKKRFDQRNQQWKKEWLDQQLELQKELQRALLDQAVI